MNFYAVLLLLAGAAAVAVPLYRITALFLFIQIPAAFFCLYQSARIFSVWPDKRRRYEKLLERNATEWEAHSFRPYMISPCGRLLVKAVLSDLNRKDEYRNLKQYIPSLKNQVKLNCRTEKTVVYINKDFK
ncbi:MAG: hypothetical protein SOZ27_00725 [Spirochaetia bacterium]|nr:hypothetical protein [Spirochaetia bacterium]